MAKNKEYGNSRKGAIRSRKQYHNSHSNLYVKKNMSNGQFMSNKHTPFKDVTKNKKR